MLHPGAKFNLLAASKDGKFAISTPGCHHWETSSFQGLFVFFPRFQPAAGLMERIQAIAQNVSDIAIKVDQILRNSLLNGKGECPRGSPCSKTPMCYMVAIWRSSQAYHEKFGENAGEWMLI